ncbi:MAG: hypothetical protein ABSE43_03060 [Steroidobacteraceae bacterium]
MSSAVRRHLVPCGLALLTCVLAISRRASADNFGPNHYEQATNELVVTILYGGTNSNHMFTLKWGPCQIDESGHRMPLVNAEILDDQFNDAEQQQYTLVKRFSLADMPCPRPAKLSVSTAPGFSFELVIPK